MAKLFHPKPLSHALAAEPELPRLVERHAVVRRWIDTLNSGAHMA
jgi:hypothetical protein